MHGIDIKFAKIACDVINVTFRFYSDESEDDNVSWFRIDNYTITKPMSGCGYITHKDYIVTFGGYVGCDEYIDTIYILDMKDKEKGWIESEIKCPEKSTYCAILTTNNQIHLFQGYNTNRESGGYSTGHYSINLSSILPDQNNSGLFSVKIW